MGQAVTASMFSTSSFGFTQLIGTKCSLAPQRSNEPLYGFPLCELDKDRLDCQLSKYPKG